MGKANTAESSKASTRTSTKTSSRRSAKTTPNYSSFVMDKNDNGVDDLNTLKKYVNNNVDSIADIEELKELLRKLENEKAKALRRK